MIHIAIFHYYYYVLILLSHSHCYHLIESLTIPTQSLAMTVVSTCPFTCHWPCNSALAKPEGLCNQLSCTLPTAFGIILICSNTSCLLIFVPRMKTSHCNKNSRFTYLLNMHTADPQVQTLLPWSFWCKLGSHSLDLKKKMPLSFLRPSIFMVSLDLTFPWHCPRIKPSLPSPFFGQWSAMHLHGRHYFLSELPSLILLFWWLSIFISHLWWQVDVPFSYIFCIICTKAWHRAGA